MENDFILKIIYSNPCGIVYTWYTFKRLLKTILNLL